MSESPPLADALCAAAAAVEVVLRGQSLDRAFAALSPSAAAKDLAYGTLRGYGRGDLFLARLLRSPLKEPRVRALLLVALFCLETRGEKAHTVVDQAVEAAKRIAAGRFSSLANAVLRNFLRQRETLIDAAQHDAVAHWRHPAWWVARVRSDHPEAWEQILDAGNQRPPMTLRVNRRRIDPQAYLALLGQGGVAGKLLGDDAILLDKPQPVEALPGFFAGMASVQDYAAQQAAALLDVRPGMRVLDACAAPGGKTAHILEISDAEMTALDADAGRLGRVGDNLRRLGFTAQLQAADCRATGEWWDGRRFDRILADVPCSASGVVRRHPDAKWLRRESDIGNFATTQGQILEALWQVLAPGGKMLYCTCSIFAQENALQLASFTSRHADAERLPTGGARHELQLTPSAEHDGFYYALLAKRG